MNVPFFIKERLWMSDFDETKLKKTFGGSKPFSKWTLKTITTVLAAVMIFEVVNNWRCVLPDQYFENKLEFEP